MTLPLLAAARQVYFVVTGAGKADVLRRVLEGGDAEADGLPARAVLQACGDRVHFVVDHEAAAKLSAGAAPGSA